MEKTEQKTEKAAEFNPNDPVNKKRKWREPTGPLYYTKFIDGSGNAITDGGQVFTLAFYANEFDDALSDTIGPKDKNGLPVYSKYDMLFQAGNEPLSEGILNSGEDNAMALSLPPDLTEIDREKLLEGLRYMKKWLARHRELALTGEWRDFFDWNWDHLDEMRADFKVLPLEQLRIVGTLANYMGNIKFTHMWGKCFSELLNGKTRPEIADMVGREIELTDAQAEAVKKDIYEGKTTPSPETGITL